ncbi:MAG: molybdenum ABC transporter ATP-binding protein [Beijerinckiaceae bacterium]|nr:molybdenum ABC transporter ATP-binding protein [Beijerinckiaceae bacterium]
MALFVSIDHRLGAFRLRANFACEGRLTALFGPSGSGKTSVVSTIAGLLKPDTARIVIDGEALTDTQSGVCLPAHRRQIGYVFQEARLFPHMNVRQNLTYAQMFGGRGGRAGASFESVVEMLGVGPLLQRQPSLLSGGEKQRVAIGRALLSHPRLLLMDEPLASLDEARKQEILPFIERLRDEALVPIVYVSHSLAEVRRLADFVVVMDHGAVVDSGPPQSALREALFQDTSRDEADVNVLDVLQTEQLADGRRALTTRAGVFHAPQGERLPTRVSVSSCALIITLDDPGRAAVPSILQGVVRSIAREGEGQTCRVIVRAGEADLVARAPEAFVRDTGLREGAHVYLLVTALRMS